jgi:uncharacterized protein YjbI with pentapeptide repeats
MRPPPGHHRPPGARYAPGSHPRNYRSYGPAADPWPSACRRSLEDPERLASSEARLASGYAAGLRSSSMANGGEKGVQNPTVVPRWLRTLWDAHPLVVVACVAVVALAVAVALIWPVTDLIAAHDVGVITGPKRAAALQSAREAVRTQLLTLGAGVFAAGALVYTARNFRLSRQTFELTEQGQVTDRYTKAIEQLGSDKPDVRIGGIYALERIARDSKRDHPTVMEVLAAFIREHSHEAWSTPLLNNENRDTPRNHPTVTALLAALTRQRFGEKRLPSAPGPPAPKPAPRPDVQAAVSVIGRRDSKRDREPIDLTRADLSGADLTRADLTQVNLYRAILTHADLALANLTSTHFGAADLTGASLRGARYTSTYFGGANLTDADLTDADLAGQFLAGANLTDARLWRADLAGAKLGGANLTGAKLGGTNLNGANLNGANLNGAKLGGGFIVDFAAFITGEILGGADLTGADLGGANLTGADLADANLRTADLTYALLSPDAAVPEGWQRDPGSGRLRRAETSPRSATTN